MMHQITVTTTRTSMRQWLFGRLEGLLLVLVACYLAWLLVSDNLWQLLNPRFFWLETATAAGLLLCGGVLLLRPTRTSLLRLGSLGLLCLLLAVTLWGPEGMALPEDLEASPFAVKETQPLPPLEIDGQTFERISTPELVQLLQDDPQTALAGNWALRGMAARSSPLDARGAFALVRPFVWCCLADAVAVGFVTPWESELPETGQWVQVAGQVKQVQDLQDNELELALGPLFVALDDGHVLVPAQELGAAALQIMDEPEMPFVFSVRETPPYNW